MIVLLRAWFRRWRERRDPAVLVRRLYREGVIDDAMLNFARKGRFRHGYQPRDGAFADNPPQSAMAVLGKRTTR